MTYVKNHSCNPWNVRSLKKKVLGEKGRLIPNYKLRLHTFIIFLKEQIESEGDKIHDIDLTYLTSYGNCYFRSWKGQHEKAGGVDTNIGIQFLDILIWIFEDVKKTSFMCTSQKGLTVI